MRRAGPLLRPRDEPTISWPRIGRVLARGPHSQSSARLRPGRPHVWEQILKKQVLVTVDRGETRVGILEAEGEPSPPPKADSEQPAGRRRRGRSKSAGTAKQTAQDGWRVSELYIERR